MILVTLGYGQGFGKRGEGWGEDVSGPLSLHNSVQIGTHYHSLLNHTRTPSLYGTTIFQFWSTWKTIPKYVLPLYYS